MESLLILFLLLLAICIPLYLLFRIIFFVGQFLPRRHEKRRQTPGTGKPGMHVGLHWFGAPFYDDKHRKKKNRR